MLHSAQVPIDQSALLVIDAQDSFKIGPRWERRNNKDEAVLRNFCARGRRSRICRGLRHRSYHDFPIPNHDRLGEELGVDAICERTEYALRRRFATIATVASITMELEQAKQAKAGTA